MVTQDSTGTIVLVLKWDSVTWLIVAKGMPMIENPTVAVRCRDARLELGLTCLMLQCDGEMNRNLDVSSRIGRVGRSPVLISDALPVISVALQQHAMPPKEPEEPATTATTATAAFPESRLTPGLEMTSERVPVARDGLQVAWVVGLTLYGLPVTPGLEMTSERVPVALDGIQVA